MNITVFDKHNYEQFFKDSEDLSTYMYMVDRWIKSKERTLPCYTILGYDEEGHIHVKYALPGHGNWTPLNKAQLTQMNDYI
tara:strand:- start:1884 stop:2126 length:243 start_codon:yes stop_codon:yes gene_type:complete